MIVAGMEMPGNMGAAFTEAFQAIFPRVAESKQAALVPFLLEGVGGVTASSISPTSFTQRPTASRSSRKTCGKCSKASW